MEPLDDGQPYLDESLAEYWDAFCQLYRDRQINGFGHIGPIELSTIRSYAVSRGITELEELETFERLVRAVDDVYVEVETKRMNVKTDHSGDSDAGADGNGH